MWHERTNSKDKSGGDLPLRLSGGLLKSEATWSAWSFLSRDGRSELLQNRKYWLVFAGFSLIELLMVIVILSILLMVAFPSYRSIIQKQNRYAVQSEIVELASKIEMQNIVIGSYAKVINNIFPETQYFPDNNEKAVYELKAILMKNTYQIVAVPMHLQQGDGRVVFDSSGKRCWYDGFDFDGGKCTAW